jgi:glutamate--cysteine ligase
MTAPARSLHRTAVDDHVRAAVFADATSAPSRSPGAGGADATDLVGIELEWLTSYCDPSVRVTTEQVAALRADLCPMPGGSTITMEPGGQIELSSPPLPTVDGAVAAMATDVFTLDQACCTRRIDLVALGADPVRVPERVLHAPRYAAMQRYFDADGPAGREMMTNTASIQVNLGLGSGDEAVARWRLAHAVAPTLLATFANSPFSRGRRTGWQSSRLRAWWTLDPTRAGPPRVDGDAVGHWIDYALDARVMFVRDADGTCHPLTERLSFGDWMARGHELGWPTLDDFAYHLTTLFPPVRPRGWLEVRVLDALPTPFWQVAVLATYAVLTTAGCDDAVTAAVEGTTDLWVDAAQLGLRHPALAAAARRLFAVVLDALDDRHVDPALVDLVGTYTDRWVARGRSPADDRIERYSRDGALLPGRESPLLPSDLLAGARR